MCAIIGAIIAGNVNRTNANVILNRIIEASHERGRDGRGFVLTTMKPLEPVGQVFNYKDTSRYDGWNPLHLLDGGEDDEVVSVIGNLRAEPTTEFVREKSESDQQPYTVGPWSIVHNGTIANDAELRTHAVPTSIDSAAIVEALYAEGSATGFEAVQQQFLNVIGKLKGSYAILAVHQHHPTVVFTASNYRPIWVAHDPIYGTYFASSRNYFPAPLNPVMLEPYSAHLFVAGGFAQAIKQPRKANRKALVICSGGLDSVVAATYAKRALDLDITLLHFQYGSRAEGPEVQAVSKVAEALDVDLRYFPLPIYSPEDSPLLQHDSAIAGGEAGAEFAHEWVPARNLAMLAVATALAEAGGFETLVLGNNLEEAGAYPDNEPEFIERFNDLLPFAVGDGKSLEVIMPVGNLMKHEIVNLGLAIGAPLDKTWSCYRAGHEHCGTCGPCFMRRTAFEINNAPEVITYASDRTDS